MWAMPKMSKWSFNDGTIYIVGTGNIYWLKSYHFCMN